MWLRSIVALKRIGVEENPKRRKHPGVKHNCCQLCVPIVFYWIFQARISGLDSSCRSIFPKGETPTGLNTAFAFTKNKETQLGGGMPGGTARVLCFWGSPKTRLPLNKIHSVNKVTRQREKKSCFLYCGSQSWRFKSRSLSLCPGQETSPWFTLNGVASALHGSSPHCCEEYIRT